MQKYKLIGATTINKEGKLHSPAVTYESELTSLREFIDSFSHLDYWVTTDSGKEAFKVCQIKKIE